MLSRRERLSHPPVTHTLTTHREPPAQHGLIKSFISLLYPTYCCHCRRGGEFLCPTCFESIQFYSQNIHLKLENNYLDSVTVMAKYAPPISSLIQAMKYQSIKRIGAWCGELLYMHTNIPSAEVVVPVPLSKQRFRERGFNQAQEMGKALSDFLGVPCLSVLERTKHLAPQAGVQNQEKRKSRLDNCFTLREKYASKISYSSVLLLDDVLTTGATLNECAKVLKHAGVKYVHALALAHGN